MYNSSRIGKGRRALTALFSLFFQWDIAELQLNLTGDTGDAEQSGACKSECCGEKENDK